LLICAHAGLLSLFAGILKRSIGRLFYDLSDWAVGVLGDC
jgi:hypothetical protein